MSIVESMYMTVELLEIWKGRKEEEVRKQDEEEI